NHIRGPSRRAQGAQEGWTPERFAAHVVVAFPEKGLRVHHEALKGVHRPPPSTNFLRWPSRRYARFRTPSPSRGPPPQGGVLPGGNPPSRKRRYRPPRWPGASLASARVRLAESARPPWPRSPAPPPPSPSSPRDRSRSPPALAGMPRPAVGHLSDDRRAAKANLVHPRLAVDHKGVLNPEADGHL